MADRFERVVAGQPYPGPSSDFHNAIVETLRRDFAKQRYLSEPYSDAGTPLPFELLPIAIKNVSGAALDQFSVVGLGDPIVTPSQNLDEFRVRLGFLSAAPAPYKPFAIVQRSIPNDNEIGTAYLAGVSRCQINVKDIGHAFASPETGNYGALVSKGLGEAKILWSEPAALTTLNGAISSGGTTIVVASSAGFPALQFDITIESEQLTVTAISGTTWTVTRGANGTTAASHDDAIAVAFTGLGVRWGVVSWPVVDLDHVIRIAGDGVLGPDGYYDGIWLWRDNDSKDFVDGQPSDSVWGLDLSGSTALEDGAKYLTKLIGYEAHGPTCIAVASNTNDMPPSANWVVKDGETTIYNDPVSTTLDGAIDQYQTIIRVASSTGFPATPFLVSIDFEEMTVTDTAADPIWTVVRRINNTNRATHADGATVSAPMIYSLGMSATNGDDLYLYTSNTPTQGNAPPNATYWTLLPDGIIPQGAWSAAAVYVVGASVQIARPVLAFSSVLPGGEAIFEGYSGEARGPGVLTAGTWTWTCPPGVTTAFFEAWGQGGGPAIFNGDVDPATSGTGGGPCKGGGGGAYASTTFNTTPGVVYNVLADGNAISIAEGLVNVFLKAVGGQRGADGGKGGQASDCIGDGASSGGDGGSIYWNPLIGDGGVVLGRTEAGGGGGGGAGPDRDGTAGNDGNADDFALGIRPSGGLGYSQGGAGGLFNNRPDYSTVGLGVGANYENIKDNPGGGAGAAGLGGGDGNEVWGAGRAVITWGAGGPTTTPGASITTGTLATGGTGANLSATGPGVVYQSSPGAPMSVIPTGSTGFTPTTPGDWP